MISYQLFIGSTCRNEWNSSSCRSSITAYITRLHGTWWITAFQSLMWPIDVIFVLQGVIASLCLDTVSARTGFGHLLLPAQLPRTHWVMICVIRRLALTVSGVCLRLGCFQSTSTHSVLQVSHYALYIFHDLRTCLLFCILVLDHFLCGFL